MQKSLTHSFLALILTCLLPACEPFKPSIFTEYASSAHDEAAHAVIRFISEAQQSISIAGSTLPSQDIVTALVDAHARGIDVQILLGTHTKSATARLLSNGIPTRIDGRVTQHSKFMVVDAKSVETGSFNYGKATRHKSPEHLLIIRESKDLAQKYTHLWQQLWDESQAYSRADSL